MSEKVDTSENLGSSRGYAETLEHLQQLVDYVRPDTEGELCESEIVLAELIHVQEGVSEMAKMLDFLLGQFKILSPKMDGQHHYIFQSHGWPMTHFRGPTPEEALRNAMKEAGSWTDESA